MSESDGGADIPALAQAAEAVIAEIRFDGEGLVPAIAQQARTGEVLMLAWMDRDAVAATLETGYAHYYSRSRQALWRKGETSGQVQKVCDFRIDCDGDTVLVLVEQMGVACHTGRHNCFFRAPRDKGVTDIHPVIADPAALYGTERDGE